MLWGPGYASEARRSLMTKAATLDGALAAVAICLDLLMDGTATGTWRPERAGGSRIADEETGANGVLAGPTMSRVARHGDHVVGDGVEVVVKQAGVQVAGHRRAGRAVTRGVATRGPPAFRRQ